MHEGALNAETRSVIDLLVSKGVVDGFYLAGGTAASLYFGHRVSHDLDWFTEGGVRSDALEVSLAGLGQFELSLKDEQTVIGLLNQVKVSFFQYRYPLLLPSEDYRGCRVAHPIDIALMKMTAIAGRGSKKDFFDLFVLCQKTVGLKELLTLYVKKYTHVGRYHAVRSLTYFEDAEKEADPVLLVPLDWGAVKEYFIEQVPTLVESITKETE